MPFVPLGSRKRIEVVLDHDKERIGNEMRTKDFQTVKLHHQVMPGATGYRYANHPITMGPVRGPPAPFEGANKPWAPPEHEPDGMAAARDLLQAPVGAYREGSHEAQAEGLRKTRSTPALTRTMAANPIPEGGKSLGEQAKEKANPISIELCRWQRLAEVTKRDLASMPALTSTKKTQPPPPKPIVTGGLVNFPKYMLFENSHLKTTEFQRYCDSEAKARQEALERTEAAEEAMSRGETTPADTSREASQSRMSSGSEVLVPYGTASWGQPRLRGPWETVKQQWAGSAMPHGKSTRSSNPFRMG